MKLKRLDTGEVIFEMECSTFRELVEGATKEGISFYRADMRGAVGNMEDVKSMQLEKYMIAFTSDILCIGCQQHTIEEWASFTDEKISQMDDGALEWWKKWKDFIFTAIEMTKDIK